MLILVKIIGTHYRPSSAIFYSCFECREIYLVERTIVDDNVCIVAFEFLIVQRIMLDTYRNTVVLAIADIRHNHLRCKIRVFAHILEITAVERCAQYVHSGTEQDVLSTIKGFFGYGFAVERRHVRIP